MTRAARSAEVVFPRRYQENRRTKAMRLRASDPGVLIHAPAEFKASVFGDHGVHTVERKAGHWHCDCQAHGYGIECSHILAVRALVTTNEGEGERNGTLQE
ncbi:MAG: hypothetical protein WC683_04450 [bacterium]